MLVEGWTHSVFKKESGRGREREREENIRRRTGSDNKGIVWSEKKTNRVCMVLKAAENMLGLADWAGLTAFGILSLINKCVLMCWSFSCN